MKRRLAFVLGGGGARGALQVGALRALIEAGYQPDLLVGTSIGAVNAAFLALNGCTLDGVDALQGAWRDAIQADLLPQNYVWLTVRSLFRSPDVLPSSRLRDFFIRHGLKADLRFADIPDKRLLLVAADLNRGSTHLYGLDSQEFVLEGLLASTALPPWVSPIEKESLLLIDGGALSTLPIEPAMQAGATEIIALDLFEPREAAPEAHGFGAFMIKLLTSVERRQNDLERALAQAQGVPLHYLLLQTETPLPLWDFRHSEALMQRGYALAKEVIPTWKQRRKRGWLRRIWGRMRDKG